MLCTKCGELIVKVNIISECWRKGEVNKDGVVVDFGDFEEFLDTVKIEHRDNECYADLTGIVEDQ